MPKFFVIEDDDGKHVLDLVETAPDEYTPQQWLGIHHLALMKFRGQLANQGSLNQWELEGWTRNYILEEIRALSQELWAVVNHEEGSDERAYP
jgi:hypothetical protein